MISRLFGKQKLTYNGNYRGVVVDNSDPLALGRIRVRVYGIMQSTNVPTASIPWATPMMPLSSGAGTGSGSFYVPVVGTEVFVFFEQGNPMSPVYIGEAQNGVKGLPSFKDLNYPSTLGTSFPDGLKSFVDIVNHYFRAEHPVGTSIEVTNDGNANIKIVNDLFALIGEDLVEAIGRDKIVDIMRNFYVSVGNNFTVTVANEASVTDIHDERLVPVGTGPIPTFLTSAPSGWLLMYGQTLGDASSGATAAAVKYSALFEILKSIYPNNGTKVFANHETIIIPDMRGRVPVTKDNMGGSQAGVLTNTFNPNRNTLGQSIGEESHQLVIAEMPSHHHSYNTVIAPGAGDSGGALDTYQSVNTGDTGGDQAHQNVQPGIIVNMMIKY